MPEGRIIRPEDNTKIILPRIGILKTGMKNDKGFPTSVDYFIATGKYASYFTKAYGDKPSVIQIVFFDESASVSCNERYELRDSDGRLFAKGDGETFDVWTGKNYQSFSRKNYPEIMAQAVEKCQSKKGWEVTLTLRFVLPRIKDIRGFWEYSTKAAASSIPSIRGTFDTIQEQNGYIFGVLFDLTVTFAKSQKPGAASRYPVVSLIPNMSEDNVKLVRQTFSPITEQAKLKDNNG